MVDSGNNPNNYMVFKISIEVIIKYTIMLKFVPDHLKTKKMCQNAVNNLPFVIMYVPGQYKTKQMCVKVILENGGILEVILDLYILENGGILKVIPDRYKNKKMCDKAVASYSHDAFVPTLQFVPNRVLMSKMLEKLDKFVFSNDDLHLDNIGMIHCYIFSDDVDGK